MRRTSLGIVAVTFAEVALAACATTLPDTIQIQAPSTPVAAGFGSAPINAGFGNDSVTSGYHDTEGAPTYRP